LDVITVFQTYLYKNLGENTNLIPFFNTTFTKEMEDAAIHSLRNELYVLGESMYKFEEEFARYIGTKYAISLSSGTAALHLSLLALGMKENSRVVTSTNSFVASANCIMMTGSKPVLTDINPDDGNMDIASCDYTNSNAIIPVHLYGNPCDMEKILEISKSLQIPIVEDACQAHGAAYQGKKIGSLGEVGCFSFYTTKNMCVGGDGGMVTTNNEEIANKIKLLRNHGRFDREDHREFGYGFRLNTVNAAIGRVQLRHLDEWNNRRREIYHLYKKKINGRLLKENEKGHAVFHQIVLHTEKRESIINHLKKNGIGYGIHYHKPIHKYDYFAKKFGFNLPKSELFCQQIISLASYPELTNDQVKQISEIVNEALA
jgi:perosamine synthetase